MLTAKAALTLLATAAATTAGVATAATETAPPPQLVVRAHELVEFTLAGNAAREHVLVVPRESQDAPPGLDVFTATPGTEFGPATRLRGRNVPFDDPAVAVGPDGTVAVVGLRQVTGPKDPRRLMALEREPGGEFGKPRAISGPNAGELSLAFDRAGAATAVWSRVSGRDPFAEAVEYSTRPPRGEWSAPTRIAFEKNGVSTPQVAFDAAGDAVVVWTRDGPSKTTSKIVVSTRPAAAAEFARPKIVSDPRVYSEEPSLSVNAAGQAALTWVSATRDLEHLRVSAAFRDDPSEPFGPPRVISSRKRDGFAPSLALDDQGRALVTWATPGIDEGSRVVSAVRSPGGPVRGRIAVSDGHSGFPHVAVAPDGRGVLAWPRHSRNGDLVQARTASTTGGLDQTINYSPRGAIYEDVQLDIDDSGSAHLAWIRGAHHRDHLEVTLVNPATGYDRPR